MTTFIIIVCRGHFSNDKLDPHLVLTLIHVEIDVTQKDTAENYLASAILNVLTLMTAALTIKTFA